MEIVWPFLIPDRLHRASKLVFIYKLMNGGNLNIVDGRLLDRPAIKADECLRNYILL